MRKYIIFSLFIALLIDQEDAQLLRIVEGYCSSSHLSRLLNKQGQRSNNRCFTDQPPQLIVAEDEKILVEEVVGDEIIVQEKFIFIITIDKNRK